MGADESAVGVAVIGSTGVIGRVHLAAIGGLDNCRLIGVSARRQDALRRQARDLGAAAYPALDDALADDRVDAVIIATPHPSHAEITMRAAQAGKHVLCEKPMAVAPSEGDAMVAACREAGAALGVLYNNRFRPEALKMRELVDAGAIGEIYRSSMTSAMIRSQDYYDRLSWRGTWRGEGGGALLNQGIHGVDMLQWLAGMPKTVTGAASALRHRVEVEDYASALLEYANGAHGFIHCSTSQAPQHQRLELWGELGAIVMDDWSVTLHRLDTPVRRFIEEDRSPTYDAPTSSSETFRFEPAGNTHAAAIGDFCDAILEGREPKITGEDALKSQELSAAITLSAHRRKPANLPLDRAEYDALMSELRGAAAQRAGSR